MSTRLIVNLIIGFILFGSISSCSDKPAKKPVKIEKVSKKGTKAKKGKKTAKKKGAKSGKQAKGINWAKVQKDLKLSKQQVASLKKIQKRHEANVTALKKAKKWDGPKNAKNRASLKTKKVNSQKSVLKKKFKAFQDYFKKPKSKK